MLSYIDDFIPPAHRGTYRDALRGLQVRARPLRREEVEAVIREELGAPPGDIFARFDPEPIAAASIGQVYRAALACGTEVAVKVQYPGIREAILSDLKNAELFRAALSLVLPKVDVDRSLADITSRVLEECDYACELCNQEEFARAWEGDAEVRIPRVFRELSGARVLTSEHVAGPGFHEMLARTGAAERARYAAIMYRFVFRSLYVHGLFNADPHPGNYLYPPDGRVAFLDFGCVQRYDADAVAAFRRVRRLAMDGARGAPFREAMQAGYGIPADIDEEEWAFLEEYVLLCFEPVRAPRFRFDRAYTERIADLTLRWAPIGARKALRKGVWEAKRPGLVFLGRIQYGFASVLAAMDVEADWRAIMEEIDGEDFDEPAVACVVPEKIRRR